MKEEFTNAIDVYCAFTDEGILCETSSKSRFFPYGSIEKINFVLGALDVQGKANGEKIGFFYSTSDNQQKVRLKELVAFAKAKMITAAKTDVVEIDSTKASWLTEADYNEILKKSGIVEAPESKNTTDEVIIDSEFLEKSRVKNRNIGIGIMIISILVVLIACIGDGLGILAVIAVFVGFIGLLIFAKNINASGKINY